MQLIDLHTHTNMSDGTIELPTLVETEEQLGNVLGVSDHLFTQGIYTVVQVRNYLEALLPYRVYRGCEVNMEHNFALPDDLDRILDYVIASVHSMPDGRGGLISLGEYMCKRAGDSTHYSKNYSPDLCRQYLAYTLRMIEKTFSSQRVDILGHATVLPAYDELLGTRFLLDWENALLGLCLRYGVALEISGLWRVPGMDMLKRAKTMGVTFSMGSDCHTPIQIGAMDYVCQAIEEVGLTQEDFFVPSRTL